MSYPGRVSRLSKETPTIASTTTIAVKSDYAFVSGTTAIATITALPGPFNYQIALIPTGIFTLVTTGNIALASTAVVSKVLFLVYDRGNDKWYPSY